MNIDINFYLENLNIVVDEGLNQPIIVIEYECKKYEMLNISTVLPILPPDILNCYLIGLLKQYYELPFDVTKYICVNKYISKCDTAFYDTYYTIEYLINNTNVTNPSTVCYNLIMYCGRNSDNFFRSDLVKKFACVKKFILKYRLLNDDELIDLVKSHANKMLKIRFTNYSSETVDSLLEYYFSDCPYDPLM